MKNSTLTALLVLGLAACGDDEENSVKTDAEFRTDVVAAMHSSIEVDLAALVTASKELQTAAPEHAWNATTDAAAITAMKAAWKKTRVAYEHVEGATAPLFGELDGTMDARYDDYLSDLAPDGDADLFDAEGVTGMHGIERILYAHEIRAEVITFESTQLDGYVAARWPETDDEAKSFKNVLVKKLIDDATTLHDTWEPNKIDIDESFRGLVGLMDEQQEKVNLAATGEEESRYANLTLFDLRNNLEGTRKIYDLFQPWIVTKPDAKASDDKIQAKFTAIAALYNKNTGDALPAVPDGWSAVTPTPAQLATPFGELWTTIREAVDPDASGSVVFEMNAVAATLQLHAAAE